MDRTMYGKVLPGTYYPFRCAMKENGISPGCEYLILIHSLIFEPNVCVLLSHVRYTRLRVQMFRLSIRCICYPKVRASEHECPFIY